jgi:acetoin utilization protein AcuB
LIEIIMMLSNLSNLFSFLLILQVLGRCFSFSTPQSRVFISTPTKSTTRIVSDLMTSLPNLLTLSPHTPVDGAISQLLEAGVSGAPVVERLKNAERPDQVDCRLFGFVSSFDFLPREESASLVTLGRGEAEDSETARRILGRSVRDIMTRDPVTITTNDLMKTAAELMARHRLHALPVVDANRGNLVGIVTAKDVMRDVMKIANKELGLPAEDSFSQPMADISP